MERVEKLMTAAYDSDDQWRWHADRSWRTSCSVVAM